MGDVNGSSTFAALAAFASSATTALTASLALDVQSLSATKITSGRLSLDRLPTSATVNTILKVTTANQSPTYTTLSAIDIPDLSTEKITSGVLPIVRGGTGANSFTSGRILYAGSTSVTSSANLTFDGTKLTTLHISASGGITGSLLGDVNGSSTFAALAAFASSATTSISSSFVNISTTTANSDYSIPFVLNSGYSQMGVDGTSTSGHLQYNPSTNTLFVGQNTTTSFGKIVLRTRNSGNTANGNVTIKPPLAQNNYEITLPSAAGTLARTDDVGVTLLTMGTGISGSVNPIVSTGTISLAGQALSLHQLNTNGYIVRNGTTISARAITSGSNNITVGQPLGATGDTIINIRDIAALSVMGRSANSAGDFVDISAADHKVLRRSGTTLGFGSLDLAQSATFTGTLPVGNGGTGATSFTAGKILFGNGTSAISTDTNLHWDDVNNRLGVGTSLPTTRTMIQRGTSSANAPISSNATLNIVGNNITLRTTTTAQEILYLHQPNTNNSGQNKGSAFSIALSYYQNPGNNLPRTKAEFRTTGRSTDNTDAGFTVMSLFDTGDITITGTATGTNFILESDRRLKKDISDIETGIELVSQLQPKEYIKKGNKEFGFITDEIPEELDFLVKRGGEYEALDYISMIGILVKSVQELKTELDTIKKNMK